MSKNVNSLISLLTLNITETQFKTYFESLFHFLSKSNSNNEISYISFQNYLSLYPFIATKLYHLFKHDNSPSLLTKEQMIDGLCTMYIGDFEKRAKLVFQFLDFDNDNVITIEDVKLIASHFHYITNKTKISELMEHIEEIFGNGKNKIDYESYINIIKKNNSDIMFLFLFYFLMNKPFQESEIDYYINNVNNSIINVISLSTEYSNDNNISNVKYSFAEPTEFLFDYLNSNFKCGLDYYLSILNFDESESDDELNELSKLEEDISKIKNESMISENQYMNKKSNSNRNTQNSNFLLIPNGNPRTYSSTKNLSLTKANSFSAVKQRRESQSKSIKSTNIQSNLNLLRDSCINSSFYFNPEDQDPSISSLMFSSEAFINCDEGTCEKCNINIVGNMIFINKNNVSIPYMVPIKQLYIQSSKVKKNKKIYKASFQSKGLHQIFIVNVISGLNIFTTFKLSFYTEEKAEEFINVIEKKMKFRDIKEDFIFGKVVGKGGFSKIRKCTHINTNKTYCVKIISKFFSTNNNITCVDDIESYDFIVSEIDVCRYLFHLSSQNENIVTIKGIYETFNKIYIVMDYIDNGNLEHLIETEYLSISIQNKHKIASQLINAVSFLHKNRILHRDIKAANILIDKNYKIYLCDFGLSYIIGDNEYIKGSFGTINYAPPEIINDNKRYNTSIDIWSMGVVLYYLYYGELPFNKNEKRIDDIIRNINNMKLRFYEIDDGEEKKLHESFVKIIKMCLVREAEQRPKAEEIVRFLF